MREKLDKKKVVIIGATGGLGQAYTKMFLEEGASVYLGGRSLRKLHEQYGHITGSVKVGRIEIQDAESVIEFVKQVQQEWGMVDYVINATGYDVRKELAKHSEEEIQISISTNLIGAVHITKYFLPVLKDTRESTIVHMGGFVDGGLAFPYYSVDVATRAGVFSFCESMNRELKQTGYKCYLTYFCPNPANTEAEIPYHPIWKEMRTSISTVEEVAFALKKTLVKRKKVSIMGGRIESGFSKLNHISTSVSDFLVMNWYSTILQKYLGEEKLNQTKRGHFGWKLIMGSVISYLPIFALPCISIGNCYRVVIFVILNMISWGMFFVGTIAGARK